MKRLLDFNPVTRTAEYFEYDELTDKITVRVEEDVSPYLEFAKAVRQQDSVSKNGIKESWWQYAIIPPTVQMELRNKGIDILNPEHAKRTFQEVNANYPYLKLTDQRHF
jgi:hypothetical protein